MHKFKVSMAKQCTSRSRHVHKLNQCHMILPTNKEEPYHKPSNLMKLDQTVQHTSCNSHAYGPICKPETCQTSNRSIHSQLSLQLCNQSRPATMHNNNGHQYLLQCKLKVVHKALVATSKSMTKHCHYKVKPTYQLQIHNDTSYWMQTPIMQHI